MIRVLFVCHGNICRSPMAEFLLKDLVRRRGIAREFYIASAATSSEEIGNPVHRGTRKKLAELNISCSEKRRVRMRPEDYRKYDYLIGMDAWNLRNIWPLSGRIPSTRCTCCWILASIPRDIADPWYTGGF